jgi:hypothetical protein
MPIVNRAGRVPKIAIKKYITLAAAGLFLFSVQPARAQRQVEPPAVPPMLEGQRPLAQPEAHEPTAPKQVEAGTAKPKAKAKTKAKPGKKAPKKATVKSVSPKKAPKDIKTKGQKNHKKKPPETRVRHRGNPVVG